MGAPLPDPQSALADLDTCQEATFRGEISNDAMENSQFIDVGETCQFQVWTFSLADEIVLLCDDSRSHFWIIDHI